jgi:hypothetical protein
MTQKRAFNGMRATWHLGVGDPVIAFMAASISTFYLRIIEERALYIALQSHAQIAQIP